jgi:hypothetical protein
MTATTVNMSSIVDEGHVGIVLGAKNRGSLNMEAFKKIFGYKPLDSFTREIAFTHIVKLPEDHFIFKQSLRLVSIPNKVAYSIAVIDDTECIVLEPSAILEIGGPSSVVTEPMQSDAKIKQCCERMYPMHRPGDGAIVCAYCKTMILVE